MSTSTKTRFCLNLRQLLTFGICTFLSIWVSAQSDTGVNLSIGAALTYATVTDIARRKRALEPTSVCLVIWRSMKKSSAVRSTVA